MGLKERLLNSHWFTEDKWEEEYQILPYYIGPLSATDEWHALQTGVYYGISPGYDKIPESVYDEESDIYSWEVEAQSHYAQKGFSIAHLLTPNDRKGYVFIPSTVVGWEICKKIVNFFLGVV